MIETFSTGFRGDNDLLELEARFPEILGAPEPRPQQPEFRMMAADEPVHGVHARSSANLLRSIGLFRANAGWSFFRDFPAEGSLLELSEDLLALDGNNSSLRVMWFRHFDCGSTTKAAARMRRDGNVTERGNLPFVSLSRSPRLKKFAASIGITRDDLSYWGDAGAFHEHATRIEGVTAEGSGWAPAKIRPSSATPGAVSAILDLSGHAPASLRALVEEAEEAVFPEDRGRCCETLAVHLEGPAFKDGKERTWKSRICKVLEKHDGAWSHWRIPKFPLSAEELFAERQRIPGTVFMEEGLEIPLWQGKVGGEQVELFRQADHGSFRLGARVHTTGKKGMGVIAALQNSLGVELGNRSDRSPDSRT